MKKNLQERDSLKPEEFEAGHYVFCDCTDTDYTNFFVGEVEGTYYISGNNTNFLVKCNSDYCESWSTRVDDLVVIHFSYIVRKATGLEISLC